MDDKTKKALITKRVAAVKKTGITQAAIAKKAKTTQAYVSKYVRGERVPDAAHAGIEKVTKVKTEIVPPVSYAERMKKRAASYAKKARTKTAKAAPETNGETKPNGVHVPMRAVRLDTGRVYDIAADISKLLGKYEAAIREDERKKIRERFDAHMASS